MTASVVGVVGAGVIGSGVAQALAQSDHEVILVDVSDEVLQDGLAAIRKGVSMSALLGGPRGEPDEVLSHVRPTTDYAALGEAGFVVENAVEDERVKAEIYPLLDRACSPETIFAANTSAVPIAKLAAATARPTRVLGMHFMNPVPLKKTVEVVRGPQTSEDTLKEALELLTTMGKEGIVVNDSPGFVSNRILMLTVNEAIRVLEEGVAPVEDIDLIFKSCFGHKMGPLETADLIGLDTILRTLEVLTEEMSDARFAPASLLTDKVAAGELGRKSGRGFYGYVNAR